jgi:hypothetical protein
MALWFILQPLFILAVAIFLMQQWIYPVIMSKPVFPLFRRKKKKILEIKEEKKEEMSADKALEMVNFHCTKALHFIAVAESYAENEERYAKETLEKTIQTMESVKERAEKIKIINPNKKGGV